MTDTRHMNFLRAVFDEDERVLREKETTYRGSWKRRGGVGAFMMLARKWDRLESMMETDLVRPRGETPETVGKYDVFERLWDGSGADGSGADGTALAEIRDLRRYLALVEAEMIARGVVKLRSVSGDYSEESIAAALDEKYEWVKTSDGIQRQIVSDPRSRQSEPAQHEMRLEQLDAAGLSSTDEPWLKENSRVGDDERDFYEPWTSTTSRLVTHVVRVARNSIYPSAIYDLTDSYAVLRVRLVPSSLRGLYQTLKRECNASEYALTLEDWQQDLYEWQDSGCKWVVRPEHAAWTETGETDR